MRAFACLPMLALFLSGCAAPSKSSKLENLTGMPIAGTKEETILSDISRTIYIKKNRCATDQEKREGLDDHGMAKSQTSTWVKVYPYTLPLLSVRLRKNIEDKAFKEKWDSKKTETEVQSSIQSESKRLIGDRQCFAVEINSGNAEAVDLNFWYGELKQGTVSQKLSFSKGEGFVRTTRTTYVNGYGGSYTATHSDLHEYFYYAEACGTGPLNIAVQFSIQIEPRYDKDLIPINLEWLAPN